MEVTDQPQAPAALPQYLLNRRLGGSWSRSGRGGEEKENAFIALDGNQTSVVQPVEYSL
jgi:hypothetical protein